MEDNWPGACRVYGKGMFVLRVSGSWPSKMGQREEYSQEGSNVDQGWARLEKV